MNRFAIVGAVTVVAAASLYGCSTPKKIAAHVGAEEITESEFYDRAQSVNVFQLGASYQAHGPVKAGDYAMMTLIFEKLLLGMAKEKGVVPTDAQINAYIPFAKKYQQKAEIVVMMPDPGRVDADWKRDSRLALIRRSLAMKPLNITDADVKKWYEDHKAQLTPADAYQLRVIDCSSMDKATKALAAVAKVPFETVALTQSEDMVSKGKGGDIGTIPQTSLPVGILNAVKDLKPGEYTKQVLKLNASEISSGGNPAAGNAPHFLLVQLIKKVNGVTPTLEESKLLGERSVIDDKDPGAFQRVAQEIETYKDKHISEIKIQLAGYTGLMDKKPGAPGVGAVQSPSTPIPAGK